MVSNIVIRLIQDSEQKKSYLAVEGDITSASVEEKERYSEKLNHAIRYMMGLEERVETPVSVAAKATPASVKADFELTDEPVPDCLKPSTSVEEKHEEPVKEEIPLEDTAESADEPVIGFGRHRELTPSQLAAQGSTGLSYVEWLAEKADRPTPEVRAAAKAALARFKAGSSEPTPTQKPELKKPEPKKDQDSDQKSAATHKPEIKSSSSSSFDLLVQEADAFIASQEDGLEGFNLLCELTTNLDMNYEKIKVKRDERLLRIVLNAAKEAVKVTA